MRVKTEQTLYLALATLAMGLFVFFLGNDSMALTAVSGMFVVAIGAFLGVEAAGMLSSSSKLPIGEFKPMRKWRYILSLLVFAIILGEAFALQQLRGAQMGGVYGSCGAGMMFVFGLLMGGIEANKIATKKGAGVTDETTAG